ncbi:MAG: phage portal protein [Candidatus Aenigmarchaeota archaeon]|nr:phage portal protein [Candidatus Aenigmarchaeota archaeon]
MAKIKNVFPTATDRERMKTLDTYTKLYDNQQQAVLPLHDIVSKQYQNSSDLVYLGHAIPAKVSDFYGDFVQGDVDRMTLDYLNDDGDGLKTFEQIVEDNDLMESINDWATDQSSAGFVVLLGYVQDGKYYVQAVSQDQYYPQSDGTIIFATYFRDPDRDEKVTEQDSDLFLYTQLYEVINDNVQITRQVWTTDIDGTALEDKGEEAVRNWFGVDPLEIIENLDTLPIVQIDNGRRTRWGYGKSDYHDIMPQLGEVNERRTHIATQLLKTLDAKIELPNIEELKNEDGSLKYFEYIMRDSKEDPEARYITNENPLLGDAETHITTQLQMISYITDVPMWALLDSSAPERVESMKIKLFGADRKTRRKRAKIKKGVKRLVEIGFKMLGKEMTGDVMLEFSDVLPQDEKVETEIETEKVRGGLSSKRSAMKRLENYDEENLDAEEEQMKKETVASGAVDPNDAPTL